MLTTVSLQWPTVAAEITTAQLQRPRHILCSTASTRHAYLLTPTTPLQAIGGSSPGSPRLNRCLRGRHSGSEPGRRWRRRGWSTCNLLLGDVWLCSQSNMECVAHPPQPSFGNPSPFRGLSRRTSRARGAGLGSLTLRVNHAVQTLSVTPNPNPLAPHLKPLTHQPQPQP